MADTGTGAETGVETRDSVVDSKGSITMNQSGVGVTGLERATDARVCQPPRRVGRWRIMMSVQVKESILVWDREC